jgi:hypothetical protein
MEMHSEYLYSQHQQTRLDILECNNLYRTLGLFTIHDRSTFLS